MIGFEFANFIYETFKHSMKIIINQITLRQYYKNHESKSVWRIINNEIGRNQVTHDIYIDLNRLSVFSAHHAAELTQNYIIPEINLKYLKFQNEGFFLSSVTQEETMDAYEISTWVVINCCFFIIEPLSQIMNVRL